MSKYNIEIELTEFQEAVIRAKYGENKDVENLIRVGFFKQMSQWENEILDNTEHISRQEKKDFWLEKQEAKKKSAVSEI